MGDMDEIGITFSATFSKASTLVDGGWRVSFDVNPDDAAKLAALSQFRDRLLQLAVIPFPEDKGVFGV